MNENEKRKEFLKNLISQVDELAFEKECEKMKPGINEIADGYRSYIADLGEGFLKMVERYNQCIQIARYNEVVGDTKIKARIKDFSSSCTNTEVKMLDDVFGMEIVTSTELEKEFFILFNYLLFDIGEGKDKKFNKSSGYIAYHCRGDYNPKEGDFKKLIKETIENAKVKEYKYSKSGIAAKDKKNLVDAFPTLKDVLNNPRHLKEVTDTLIEMLEHMKKIDLSKTNMPILEFHFLTNEVEQTALRGTANHADYKKTNQKLIEDYFMDGRLIRGINAPWKFVSNGDKIILQDFYDTLLDNWNFLRDEIVEKRKMGKEKSEEETNAKFDRLTATVFPFLRKYLDTSYKYDEKKEEKWGLLKVILVTNKIDFNYEEVKPIEDGLLEYLEK